MMDDLSDREMEILIDAMILDAELRGAPPFNQWKDEQMSANTVQQQSVDNYLDQIGAERDAAYHNNEDYVARFRAIAKLATEAVEWLESRDAQLV